MFGPAPTPSGSKTHRTAGTVIALRSLLFNLLFTAWLVAVAIFCLPALALPRGAAYRVAQFWGRGVVWLLKAVVGLDHRVRGRDTVPDGPVIFALKHQSAWETIVFSLLTPRFSAVVKKELLNIPLYGWYARRLGIVPIDRKAGGAALKRMVAKARIEVARGRSVMVAPEGTRTAPGKATRYQPGVAALYKDLGLPVVPVALNSGLFWGRRSFLKYPGTITLEFLEPIPPGLARAEFMALLEERIETASEALRREAIETDRPELAATL